MEEAMAPHSSTLAWKISWTEEPGGLQSMRSWRIGHDWATSLSLSCIGEGNGNPLQCSCLENPRDGGAWWAAVYGDAQSRTRMKQLSSSSSKQERNVTLQFRHENSHQAALELDQARTYWKAEESWGLKILFFPLDQKEENGWETNAWWNNVGWPILLPVFLGWNESWGWGSAYSQGCLNQAVSL